MPLYLISYDLRKEITSDDYRPLKEALAELGAVRTQLSVWYLGSTSDEVAIFNYFNQFVDDDDRLLVLEVVRKPVWGHAFRGTRDLIARYFP